MPNICVSLRSVKSWCGGGCEGVGVRTKEFAKLYRDIIRRSHRVGFVLVPLMIDLH